MKGRCTHCIIFEGTLFISSDISCVSCTLVGAETATFQLRVKDVCKCAQGEKRFLVPNVDFVQKTIQKKPKQKKPPFHFLLNLTSFLMKPFVDSDAQELK